MQNKRHPYDLTPEELEKLCEIAEDTARKHIFTKVSKSDVINFATIVDIETKEDQLNVDVRVELDLMPFIRFNADTLANEAAEKAIKAVEKKLRELTGENTRTNKIS